MTDERATSSTDGEAVTPDVVGEEPVLAVDGLVKHFPVRAGVLRRRVGRVRAVDGVSFTLGATETLGVVGESGCGKTTLGRALLRLVEPTSGTVRFRREDITAAPPRRLRELRRHLQMVFQDPFSSLDPRMTVGDTVMEPLIIHGGSRAVSSGRVGELFDAVGLAAGYRDRYPHELSGGQRQRVGIARALALRPEVLVLDEPVAALDVSVQAQVLNLLQELQQQFALSYVFISHDLSVVRHIAHRIAVMELGRIVELADRDRLFEAPAHPYTHALLSSAPPPDPHPSPRPRIVVPGAILSSTSPLGAGVTRASPPSRITRR